MSSLSPSPLDNPGNPEKLDKAVAACLAARLPSGTTLHLGFSGGRDSVVLLHILKRLLPDRLRAIHVQHGLSPNADAWASFCATLCAEWEIPLETAAVKVCSHGKGLEAAARNARYQAFRERGADYLALAHHRRDQAETLLLNLLRGAGVSGAAAMREEREIFDMTVLRPLLTASTEDITDYAQRFGLRWIEDESNANPDFRRNFLRHEILPKLAAAFPSSEANLARAAGHFSEADTLLCELAEADAARIETDAKQLLEMSPARQSNWLRWRLRVAGMNAPDAARLKEALRQFCHAIAKTAGERQGGQRGQGGRSELRLPEGRLCFWRGKFYVVPVVAIPVQPCVWDGLSPLSWAGGWLRLEKRQGEGLSAERLSGSLGAEVAGAAAAAVATYPLLSARPRQGGESLRSADNRPNRPLKKLLQEAALPPWQRERLPLLYRGEEFIACPGVGIAARWQCKAGEAGWLPVYTDTL